MAVHSFKLTSNCNRYPKKYRHSLVDRIQIKSLDIYDTLLEANRVNNITRNHERCETITRAINVSYQAWKNHASHGSCAGLIRAMDRKIELILGGRRP